MASSVLVQTYETESLSKWISLEDTVKLSKIVYNISYKVSWLTVADFSQLT